MTSINDAESYPLVHGAYGRLSNHGEALFVDATTGDGEAVRFAVSFEDVQHLVSYLLAWAARLKAAKESAAAGEPQLYSHPIPVSAVSLCRPEGGEGYLEISVGPTELLFSMPLSAFDTIGRSLLTATAQPHGTGKA